MRERLRFALSARASCSSLRKDVNAAADVLLGMERAERSRSRTLALLANLTAALGDSVFLVTLAFDGGPGVGDSILRLSGYAPNAARVVADLERVPWVSYLRLEGVPTRQVIPGSLPVERERFALAGRVRSDP